MLVREARKGCEMMNCVALLGEVARPGGRESILGGHPTLGPHPSFDVGRRYMGGRGE